MLDHILMGIEILLLVWVVYQGEIIVKCERGVYHLQKERETERAKWREQKRQQQLKKDNAPKISDSNTNTESPLPTETTANANKISDVKSAAVI